MWTYDLFTSAETAAGSEVYRSAAHRDFHIVGERVRCDNGAELANVSSKNGRGPITGPAMAASHRLPNRENMGTRTVATTGGGSVTITVYKNRTGVSENCYCATDRDLAP
jgi:hypothetical protein